MPAGPGPITDFLLPTRPDNWKVWEREILAPFLAEDPDAIRFTTYEESERSHDGDDA